MSVFCTQVPSGTTRKGPLGILCPVNHDLFWKAEKGAPRGRMTLYVRRQTMRNTWSTVISLRDWIW